MTDQKTEQTQPPLHVNMQYIKDLSFEMPNAPAIFADLQTAAPEMEVQVNLNATNIKDGTFESVLALRIRGTLKDKVVFILELSYAGVFTLAVPAEHVEPILFIECPRLLFPFARSIVAEMSREGGLPPLMLPPIDFLGLYRQRQEKKAGEGQA